MNRSKYILVFVIVIIGALDLSAQRRKHFGGHSSGAANAWVFGLHWSLVYSAGSDFGKVLEVGTNWHSYAYPSKGTIEKYLSTDFSAEIAATRNLISVEKGFNAEQFSSDANLYNVDINGKYRFVRFFIVPGFDPYIIAGAGVSRAFGETGIGANIGIGFNTWLGNGWGLNFQTLPKIGISSNKQHQYIHNSFGIVYRYFVSEIGARRLQRKQNLFGGNTPYRR